jgi:triosephosphate isomerase
MNATTDAHRLFIGVSLKMYFDHAETLQWCREVTALSAHHPAILSEVVELSLLPSFPALAQVAEVIKGTQLTLGAQNLFWEDRGPYTGEVGGEYLRRLGCDYAEIGHLERRRIFHESDTILRTKVDAALRNDLTPILCVGESERMRPDDAASLCIQQLHEMVENILHAQITQRVVVAYEPEWAIGADAPAEVSHITGVGHALKSWINSQKLLGGSQIIYGGSAGPGLLTELGDSVDGLFLGRSAHQPGVLGDVLDEVLIRNEGARNP